ncbi:MAG: hypothetical protein E4G94_00490 [ANME-2 cluster archaeon]|nr:MAG: hypothetical protein E4G94_00490 [ANME-2 cluster archaeon]
MSPIKGPPNPAGPDPVIETIRYLFLDGSKWNITITNATSGFDEKNYNGSMDIEPGERYLVVFVVSH